MAGKTGKAQATSGKAVSGRKAAGRSDSKASSGATSGDTLVRQEVRDYIEREIYPRYGANNGHGLDHIKNVVQRSLDFAQRINAGEIKTTAADFANLPASLATGKVDCDMSYVIAAFHDLGRLKNHELHHLVSAAYLLDDDFVTAQFDRDQLRVMADAVMDHRASNQLDPLTIYGRIVSSADRDTDCYDILRRAYTYNRHKHPERTEAEAVEYVYYKIQKKFTNPDAYGAKKMYFENPAFEAMLDGFRRMTVDFATFQREMERARAEES